MTVLEVITWPAQVLETKGKDVEIFDDNLVKFVKDMHETMDHAEGIGLAANQVNSLQRVITICIAYYEDKDGGASEERRWWHDKRFTLVNPVIVKKEGKIRYGEACLSFPEVYEFVDRSETVTVEAFDEFGKKYEIEADGLLAICLQHEIDHIDGVVFISRLGLRKAASIKKRLRRKRQHEVNS